MCYEHLELEYPSISTCVHKVCHACYDNIISIGNQRCPLCRSSWQIAPPKNITQPEPLVADRIVNNIIQFILEHQRVGDERSR